MNLLARSLKAILSLAVGLAVTGIYTPANAQDWADPNYRYRRPLTVTNSLSDSSLPADEVVAFSYIPNYGAFDNKSRTDGKDVKIFYHNGSTNVDVPQKLLSMGSSAGKVLFTLQNSVPPAGPAYSASENTSAGTTGYGTLPAGTKLVFPSVDDAHAVITLPFEFPFKNGKTDQLLVAIDGYVVPGGQSTDNYLRYDIDGIEQARLGTFIGPWVSDWAISDSSTMGVWADTSNPAQVVVRWEVQASAEGPVLAKFALILKPDGTIRFVYSDMVQDSGLGYSLPKYGLGLGSEALSLLTEPYSLDMSNQPDILYTQTFPVPGQGTGYWVYYGNPADTGYRPNTPPGSKLIEYQFDSGTEGWVGATGMQVGTVTASGGILTVSPSVSGGHPMAYAATMADIGDQVVYAKIRPDPAHVYGLETGIMARCGDGNGYGFILDGFGSAGGFISRTGPGVANDYSIFEQHRPSDSGLLPYSCIVGQWNYQVMKVTGAGADIKLRGRMFHDGESEPASWLVRADMSFDDRSDRRWDQGKLGITGWGDWHQLDWAYVAANGLAEEAGYLYGAEQAMPPPAGYGALTGMVTDSATGGGIPAATLTLTPLGSGSGASTTTDEKGRYYVNVVPDAYSVTVKFAGFDDKTVASPSVAEGAIVTLNIAMVAKELIANGDFETVDTAFAGKPAGWYRRNIVGTNPAPNPNADTLPWIYSNGTAHSGTRSVAISGSNNTVAWEREGSSANVNNSDNRGKGPFASTTPNLNYRVSGWVYKPGSGGTASLIAQPMSGTADTNANMVAGAVTQSVTAPTAGWVPLTCDIKAPARYLSARMYGIDIPSGETVFFDDISITRVLPATFTGEVRDPKGNPVAGAAVGLSTSASNGLADSPNIVTTDGAGRFQFSFTPLMGVTYHVQAWKDGYAAVTTPLLPADQKTIITFPSAPVFNIAAGCPVVAFSTEAENNWARHLTDDNLYQRWSSTNSTSPQFAVIDLGRNVDFSTIKQIVLWWETARSANYQLRVATTAPDPGMDAATAAGYGQELYSIATGGEVGWNPPDRSNVFVDVLTAPSLKPVTGRYLLIMGTRFSPYTNVSLWEVMVEVEIGTVTGRVVDGSTGLPLAGAFIGPFPDAVQADFTKSMSDGSFSYSGPMIPLNLKVHRDNYILSDPVTVTPTQAGVNVGDVVIRPAIRNAMEYAYTIVVDNKAALGTDTYDATTVADPWTTNNPPDNATDQMFNTLFSTNTAEDALGSPTTGANYYRFGLESTLSYPETISEIDLYWFQNGYPLGYYVSILKPGETNWVKVFETENATGGYSQGYPGDGLKVTPIKFAPIEADKVRVIFTRPSGRDFGRGHIIAEIVASQAPVDPKDLALNALKIAGGLKMATGDDMAAMDLDSDNRITLKDVVQLLRQ